MISIDGRVRVRNEESSRIQTLLIIGRSKSVVQVQVSIQRSRAVRIDEQVRVRNEKGSRVYTLIIGDIVSWRANRGMIYKKLSRDQNLVPIH